MYRDADFHLTNNCLLLMYVDSPTIQGLSIKDLSENNTKYINNHYAQGPRWSPDGSRFAYFGNGRLYIHVFPDTNPERIIELPKCHAGFCEWSPPSNSLIFSAYGLPKSHFSPPNIYCYNLTDMSITQITHNADVDRFPKWNHTGSHVVCHRTYINNDEKENHTGLVIINLDEGTEYILPRPKGFSQRISRHSWSPDNSHLIVMEYQKTTIRLAIYQIETGKVVWSIENTNIIGGCFEPDTGQIICIEKDTISIYDFMSYELHAQLSLSSITKIQSILREPVIIPDLRNGMLYFLGSDFRFYRWDINSKCEAIIEADTKTQEIIYQRYDYTFRASDGYNIPVQQYIPSKPNGKIIVFVEGGSGASIDPNNAIAQKLLEEGYEVIRPAYRGCAGYGEAHLNANLNQYGKIDVRDIVECANDYKRRFNKPNSMIAVAGVSYGGYLTFLAMTQLDAPWVCGIAFWGCTMIPTLAQTKGLPTNSQERQKALNDRSPVVQAHRIRFPLLILHGGRDTTAQTEEVKEIQDTVRKSNVSCELIIFEEESHGLKGCRPEMYSQTFKFLEMNMK